MVWPDGSSYEGNWSFSRPFGSGKFIHVDSDIYNGKWTTYWISPKETFGSTSNLIDLKDQSNNGFFWLWAKQELFKIEPPAKRKSSSDRDSLKKSQILSHAENLKKTKASVNKAIQQAQKLKDTLKILKTKNASRYFKPQKFDNGVIFAGDWKNGEKHGYGKQTWPNGDEYEGFWKFNKQNGLGKQVWNAGNTYTGEFVNDCKEGLGEYSWVDSSIYIGEWVKNKMSGLGRHRWVDGKEYVGEWVNGAREGYGEMLNKNLSKYEGEFVRDRYHGFGVFTETDGKTTTGMWANGKCIDRFDM